MNILPTVIHSSSGYFNGSELINTPIQLVIQDGKIHRMDHSFSSNHPVDTTVHDVGSSYLLPGFVDAHAHLSWCGDEDPSKSFQDNSILTDRVQERSIAALKHGITTIRDLGDKAYAVLHTRELCENTGVRLPTILTSGPPLTTVQGHCWFLGNEVTAQEDFESTITEHKKEGVDWIKVMATGGFKSSGTNPYSAQFSLDDMKAIVSIAHDNDLPVTAHAHATTGIRNAVLAGVQGIEHCSFASEHGTVLDRKLVELIVQKNIWAGITVPRIKGEISQDMHNFLEKKWSNIHEMTNMGVKIAFSSDSGVTQEKHPSSLIDDLIFVSQQGFNNQFILQAATNFAAQSCGLEKTKGRIAKGYDADILAVRDNPLHDITTLRSISHVFSQGKIIS